MFQSYKTNRSWPAGLALLFLIAALRLPLTAKPAAQRDWQEFLHYERIFLVPDNKKDELWEYVLKRYRTNNQKISTELSEFKSSYQYFDNDAQQLLDRKLVLMQQTIFISEGQQQQVEFWENRNPDWLVRVFKENKRPDKGKKFTNHPLLKLLKSRDRSDLDSLLKQWHINSAGLKPILETTQHQYKLLMRLHGSDWMILTLREVKTETPPNLYYEVSIQPDRKFYTGSNPVRRFQLKFAIDTLTGHLQTRFPELQPENRNSYLKMLQVNGDKLNFYQQLLILRRVLFIFALTLLFDIRDKKKDALAGTLTFPVKFGTVFTKVLSISALLAFAVLVHFQEEGAVRLALEVSAVAAGVVVYFTEEERPDYFFAILADGMMLLQFLMVWFFI